MGLAALAVILLATGAAWLGHQHQIAERVRRSLPPLPDLAGKAAELREALGAAQKRAYVEQGAPDSVVELGRLYHANNFNREAETCWQLLHAAQPGEARWCYYLADLRRTVGDDDGLRSWFQQTLQLAPDYAPAWLQLADLEFKGGRLDAAEHDYQQRLSLVPGDPYASLGLARVALQRGQREEGTRLIKALVSQVPDFPSSHNIYAQLLAQAGHERQAAEQRRLGSAAGRFRAAADPWLKELQSACYDPERLLEWGETNLQTKQGDRGKALFERAITLAPENPMAYQRLAAYYTDALEPAKAVEILEQGIKRGNPPELVFTDLCDAYNTLHQPASVLRVAEEGLRILPHSSILHNARAHALFTLGRQDEAIAEYHAAIADAPYAANPVASLGSALLQMGRLDEAAVCFKQALKLQPLYPPAMTLLTTMELDAGQIDLAAGHFRSIYEGDPNSSVVRELGVKLHLLQAMAAMQQNDSAGVERACREGLALFPNAASLTGFLGTYYVQQGRLGEGLTTLESAHRQSPNDPRVTLALGSLYARLGRIEDARQALKESTRLARTIGETALAAQGDELLDKLSR